MVDYPDLLEEFAALLKQKQLKFTRQRESILSVLYRNQGHYSPETIHQIIQAENAGTRVGIATVYRTLSLLEDAGLVDSISFGKEGKVYELGLKKHHDHLICTECGAIMEFIDETIEKQQEKIAKMHNFRMTGHTMKIIGVCETCQQNTPQETL